MTPYQNFVISDGFDDVLKTFFLTVFDGKSSRKSANVVQKVPHHFLPVWRQINLYKRKIKWGSEMDLKWSKRGWVANGLDFERDLKSGSPKI